MRLHLRGIEDERLGHDLDLPLAEVEVGGQVHYELHRQGLGDMVMMKEMVADADADADADAVMPESNLHAPEVVPLLLEAAEVLPENLEDLRGDLPEGQESSVRRELKMYLFLQSHVIK